MNVNLSVTYGPISVPGTVTVASVLATLTGSDPANNQSQSVAPDTASVTFANVNADTYSVNLQAIDGAGNSVGPGASTTITVTQPSSTVSVPVTVVASQS